MNNTPEVAMTVIEPGGRRWAQLLNVSWAVRDLLPVILGRLDLPERLNYELEHVRSGRVLGAGDSLQSIGIAAGEELQLKPVRDKLLIDLLDALYGEAVGYVAKQLWGQAESRIETIFRLDPRYPDPKGVRQALAARPTPSGATTSPGSQPGYTTPTGTTSPASSPRPQSASPQPPYTGGPQPQPTTPQPQYTGSPQPQPTMTQAGNAAAKPARSACSVLAILLGGLLVLAVVAAAAFGWFVLRPAMNSGREAILPFGDEPVLGTGDVQVTLRWDNTADLDLHVIDPAAEEIWFGSSSSTSGGQLDVDANAGCSGDPPVENIYWPTGGAPSGTYQVSVVYYGPCDASGPVNYEVTILVDGQTVDVHNGTLTSVGETQEVDGFSR
jgi:hypothetical protein